MSLSPPGVLHSHNTSDTQDSGRLIFRFWALKRIVVLVMSITYFLLSPSSDPNCMIFFRLIAVFFFSSLNREIAASNVRTILCSRCFMSTGITSSSARFTLTIPEYNRISYKRKLNPNTISCGMAISVLNTTTYV